MRRAYHTSLIWSDRRNQNGRWYSVRFSKAKWKLVKTWNLKVKTADCRADTSQERKRQSWKFIESSGFSFLLLHTVLPSFFKLKILIFLSIFPFSSWKGSRRVERGGTSLTLLVGENSMNLFFLVNEWMINQTRLYTGLSLYGLEIRNFERIFERI